jgi:glycosyltransferase involved in cell wall biosynthesis
MIKMSKRQNCIILLSHDGVNSASAGVATYVQTYINAFHKTLMKENVANKHTQFDFFLITTKLKNGYSFKNNNVFIHNKKIVNDLNGEIFEVSINTGGLSNYGLDDTSACECWNAASQNAADIINNKILFVRKYNNLYLFVNDTVFLGIPKYIDSISEKNIKIILVPHSTEICHKTNIKNRLAYEKEAFLSKNTFKIGYISEYFKKHLMRNYKIDEKKLISIKCTIAKDNPRFKQKTYKQIKEQLTKHNIPLDKKLVTFVGRIDPVKGIEEAIKFFSIMNAEIHGLHLVIQGFSYYENDPYITTVKNLIKSQNITNYTFLTELNLTLPPCLWQYNNTLINLCLSKNEPFGLVSIEARYMAKNNGLIAVNSNLGGFKEQIIDGFNGFLCDYGNEREYKRVIKFIKESDYSKLQKIKDNSYKDLINRYDTEENLKIALKEIGIV